MTVASSTRLSRSDLVDLWTIIVVASVVAAFTIGFAITRLAGILPNSGVEVLVPFADTTAQAPIGPGGSMVPVEIDQAVLTVSGLPTVVVVLLCLAVAIDALTVLAIVACLGILCRNLMRGRAFSRTNTRLAVTTSIVLVAGTAIGGLFQTIGINGAFATVSDYGYENMTVTGSLVPYFAAIGLAAVALAFKAGERLQRETDGLV